MRPHGQSQPRHRGAARGIGQAIADRLAANGSRVVYTDLDLAATALAAARFPGTKGVRMDVTNSSEIEAVIGQVVAEFGRLDILVNNAGVNTMAHRVTIDQFPREEWDRLLAVDLTGVFEVSRCVARIMRAQGAGRIINIASIAGLVPLRLQCAFVAAKAGVINLTRAMALELGPRGIVVDGVAPGSTLTEGNQRNSSTRKAASFASRCSGCSTMSRSGGLAPPMRSPSLPYFWPDPGE